MAKNDLSDAINAMLNQPTAQDRLTGIAQRFLEILESDDLDPEARRLMQSFVAQERVLRHELAAGQSDPELLVDLADSCGRIRATVGFRYGIDPVTDKRRGDLIEHGRRFRARKPVQATRQRSRNKIEREQHVIETAQRLLRNGIGRLKNGRINQSELARGCLRLIRPSLKDTRVRQILRKAIREGTLA